MPDPSEPWALLPSEVVCPDCHIAYHRPLGACPDPNCKPEAPK